MTKKSLGRGLSALLPDRPAIEITPREKVLLLPIENVRPNPGQPRKDFDAEKLAELAASIKEYGLVQPILVSPQSRDTYQIIAGERRYRAMLSLGEKEIPAIVRHPEEKDSLALALIENIQREDLNQLEEAETFQRLLEEFTYSQGQLAQKMGKSRPYIANALRLLSLPQSVQDMIRGGQLSAGHGKALLMTDSPARQQALAKKIVAEGLSVRQTEVLAKIQEAPAIQKPNKKLLAPELEQITVRLRQKLGTKVSLQPGRKGGRIVLDYYNNGDLSRLLELLLPNEEF